MIKIMPTSENSGKVSEYMSQVEGFEWPSPIGLESSVEELERDSRGYHIVDVGSGGGTLSEYIATQNPDSYVIGTEIFPEFRGDDVQNPEMYENLDFVVGEGMSMFRDDLLDTINMINMVQATDNPFESIKEGYDALKEGGRLILTVPGADSLGNWPDKAKRFDPYVGLPYISTPASTEEHSFVNEQYVLPEDKLREKVEELGFEVDEDRSGKIAVNPRGIPAMIDVIDEEYEPNFPPDLEQGLREEPDKTTEALLESGHIPKLDKWVLEK